MDPNNRGVVFDVDCSMSNSKNTNHSLDPNNDPFLVSTLNNLILEPSGSNSHQYVKVQ